MNTLIILGASTRAAAMSAWRAGWKPWCADLFADRDLERIATVRKVAPENYPHGLLDALNDAPPGPVMYTGGLENRPNLLAKIDRPLFGNTPAVVKAVRTPSRWTACLKSHRLSCPALAESPQKTGRWLLKAKRSAGGIGVHEYDGQPFDPRTHFLQERIDGIPCSANFLAQEDGAIYLGATQQLIGTSWLHASGSQYAGSIGPFYSPDMDPLWREIGNALASTFRLRGLLGVDAVMRDGVPWPVEVNPRYTASVEVIERIWRQAMLEPPDVAVRRGHPGGQRGLFWAKAILFARATFVFPADGPWLDSLADHVDLDEAEYADIPHAGEVIGQGRPVLTFFASARNFMECEMKLQEKAQALDRRLWG
jgi:uncharacterized protein